MSYEETLENLASDQKEIKGAIEEIKRRLTHLEGFLAGTQNYVPPAYPSKKVGPIKDEATCKKLGGTWDAETKTCKLPKEKEEALEMLLGGTGIPPQGVLPVAGVGVSSDEAKANEIIRKIRGE